MAMTAFLGVAAAVVLRRRAGGEGVRAVRRSAHLPLHRHVHARAVRSSATGSTAASRSRSSRCPASASDPGRVLAAYARRRPACISMWISNTATVGDDVPDRALAARRARDADRARRASRLRAAALLLATSFAASIGGLATPVGTPPNLIGIGFLRREAGVDVPFFAWMALGVPVVARCSLVVDRDLLHERAFAASAGAAERPTLVARRASARSGRGRAGSGTPIVAFGLTVALWVLPGVAGARRAGTDDPFYRALHGDASGGRSSRCSAPRSSSSCRSNCAAPRVHAALARGRQDRLVDRLPLRRRDRARDARLQDRPRRGARPRLDDDCSACGATFGLIALVDRARDRPLRDDQQHGVGEHGRPGRDRVRALRRSSIPSLPAIGGDDGRVARLHAAGVDAVQRDRLRRRAAIPLRG